MRRYQAWPDLRAESGGLALACVQDADIEPIRQWRNAQMDVLRQDRPISYGDQLAYFAQNIWPEMDTAQPRQILLSFRRGKELLGYGGLVHIAWPHRRAEISVLMRPDLASDRAAYDPLLGAFLLLIRDVGFNQIGLHRLYLETYAIRAAHIAVLEASGFGLEGRLRDHVRIDGAPVASLIHACLADEWIRPAAE